MAEILRIQNATKEFTFRSMGFGKPLKLRALDNISFAIEEGETFGLVGESGCGKSTLGKSVLKLVDLTSGEISYRGNLISSLSNKAFLPYRKEMQMIFQDPLSSLNPRMNLHTILEEPLVIHRLCKTSADRRQRVKKLLEMVGLSEDFSDRFPHELSGGQRQRIGIARALAVEPKFIICDEAVSSLDVSIQAQILNLLLDLQKKMGLTYLFISHDLKVVRHMSHRVAVMYLGKVVELAKSDALFGHAAHPYTRTLLSANPVFQKNKSGRIIPKGELPSPISPPTGCTFHPRCYKVEDRCKAEIPGLEKIGDDGHLGACFFPEKS